MRRLTAYGRIMLFVLASMSMRRLTAYGRIML
jgi:hypothetical protein